MSDGNFNRSLLPHNPYHSGLLAGKSMARMKAIEAFKVYWSLTHPETDDEQIAEQVEIFKKALSDKLR